jgi:hypothetical protein
MQLGFSRLAFPVVIVSTAARNDLASRWAPAHKVGSSMRDDYTSASRRVKTLDRPQFLRLFPLRCENLMWFLGAGASASAGLRTAGQMIWHFKQQIFCADNRVSVRSCPPLGDASFRARLDRYFSDKPGFPAPGSDDEYSFYFEYAYPSEQDRRTYIDAMVAGAVPSQGHFALGALAQMKRLHTAWTTNFDKLLEDVLAKMLGSVSAFSVGTLDAPELAEQALSDERRPVLIKLHGDFLSRSLKNTRDELRAQDARLRRALIAECKRKGLIIVGFSGRDASIMDALDEALDNGQGFPQGLFWIHRPDSQPATRVVQLIEKAKSLKIDAHLVEIETFDELMSDALLLFDDLPDELRRAVSSNRQWLTPVSIPDASATFPFIRFNAFPLLDLPATCRLVDCEIGGTSEVRKAVEAAQVDILAVRQKTGVIAFGSDADVRTALSLFKIAQFGLHEIDPGRLRFESSEHGLLNDALARALVRQRPLKCTPTRKGWKIYIDRANEGDSSLKLLKQAAGAIVGTVPKTTIGWCEAIRIRLERRLDRNWLLIEPAVWIEDAGADAIGSEEATQVSAPRTVEDEAIAEFVRERSAKRYNNVLNRLLDGWADALVGVGVQEAELRALGIADGIDAIFRIGRVTAFSGRIGR